MGQAPIVPTCHACPLPLACELCEACAEHCQAGDPVACAEAAVRSSRERYGDADRRTVVAREQAVRARGRMRGN